MPIFEFKCQKCSREFEKLVRVSTDVPVCPDCQSAEVEKMLSLSVAISTQKTRARTTAIARAKGKAIKKEQDSAQREYERNYIKDHS
jgi:putative FmdB family regulatory protein